MAMTTAQRRVKRLEKKFTQANDDLRDFEEGETTFKCPHCGEDMDVDNSIILNDLRKLALLREAALQELETAVRETRIGAAGMQVTVVPRREFDGEGLYNHFASDPDIRDRLVKVQYKVVSQEFDSMLRQGMISGKVADKLTLDIKETVRVNHKPKNFQLG